ncbi:MAG: bifunctional fucokinase/L-fucose-1-P-guanylyltransferase [Paramuribaculum sp.]|nr:bifunctional fucokinase/L-fucose-1-P-guanylyltransferase [Paramuribaculum sp.]
MNGTPLQLLLSLPPVAARELNAAPPANITIPVFAGNDPPGSRIGSGGGTVALIRQWLESSPAIHPDTKKIIIHSCGQSRRLPAYAATGKILTPMPVMRWSTGEKIDQTLLTMQLPLYERIMASTPSGVNTLIASGDVLLRSSGAFDSLPDVDVICFGLWAEPEQASRHGVFFSSKEMPHGLDFMLQKPSVATINELAQTHYWLMDIGLWLLSDRAMQRLTERSTEPDGSLRFYDLYSEFGCALGDNPTRPDSLLRDLTVAVLPLPEGEFLHFGTTAELLTSTVALQSKVSDQRLIHSYHSRPNSTIFVQNCSIGTTFTDANEWIWIENSCVGSGWQLSSHNVVTGVPVNDWTLSLPDGICLDMAPYAGTSLTAVRPYGFRDPMRGAPDSPDTLLLGRPAIEWAAERGIDLPPADDIYSAPLFPLLSDLSDILAVVRWMTSEPELTTGRDVWLSATHVSAADICDRTDIAALSASRLQWLRHDLPILAANYPKSVYYQLDLNDIAHKLVALDVAAPDPLPSEAPLLKHLRNAALLGRVATLYGRESAETDRAYRLLSSGILGSLPSERPVPKCTAYSDQIVWARSPVRIDLAGGWTDTPPYSTLRGGSVVNVALDLGGQPPLQAFVKPCAERHIILRSIDLGASETITDYDALRAFNRIGSPFAIPKAALALAGFLPEFSDTAFPTLRERLDAFGSGVEITLLSAVPAGSGLGTSSILAATVLAAVGDFCGLGWNDTDICSRTLALEQLLGTCGGWQDQYGGILPGVKTLRTTSGWKQEPVCNWLPDDIFTDRRFAPCHLLYYTGITRTAKGILGEIVQNIMLNDSTTLTLLDSMDRHSRATAKAIQSRDIEAFGRLVGHSWTLNQALDRGTNPPAVQAIIDKVAPHLLGCKLPGAGGGGFLYMVARNAYSASRIREILEADSVNPGARFVGMSVSTDGLRISRS